MASALQFLLLCAFLLGCNADCYLHSPPGQGDNRNRERNANSQNANRLYDSQNNNNGGYPWRGDPRLKGRADPLTYYSNSILRLEWTNQHGCGRPSKSSETGLDGNTRCEMVLQYGCNEKENGFRGLRDGYPMGRLRSPNNGNDNDPLSKKHYAIRRFVYDLRPFGGLKGQNNGANYAGTNTIPFVLRKNNNPNNQNPPDDGNTQTLTDVTPNLPDEFFFAELDQCNPQCLDMSNSQAAACAAYAEPTPLNLHWLGKPIASIQWDADWLSQVQDENSDMYVREESCKRGRGEARKNVCTAACAYAMAGVEFGMHESHMDYMRCRQTKRNDRLYHADRRLNQYDMRATRQNNNGQDNQRHGFECAEERDYYPHWMDTKWKDIAVLTSMKEHCTYFEDQSYNQKGREVCECGDECLAALKLQEPREQKIPWNKEECMKYQGVWVVKEPHASDDKFPKVKNVDCLVHNFGRDNHLGSSLQVGMDGDFIIPLDGDQPETAHYEWRIPEDLEGKQCVIRVRYNISTSDYPTSAHIRTSDGTPLGDEISYSSAADCKEEGDQPMDDAGNPIDCKIKDEPYVSVHKDSTAPKIKLQFNTNQAGRVFQDRSYVFQVRPSSEAPDGCANQKIWNLNVRGRRGNIVQAYPAVEYDFVPTRLRVVVGDCIHVGIHNSCFNRENQAGNGHDYCDGSNIIQIPDAAANFPMKLEDSSLFSAEDAEALAYVGQWSSKNPDASFCGDPPFNDPDTDGGDDDWHNCGQLNQMGHRFEHMIKVDPAGGEGTYHYVSTRNNDFSNRSQKGMIEISRFWSSSMVGMVVGVGLVGCSLAGLGALFCMARASPKSKAAGCLNSCRGRPPQLSAYKPVGGGVDFSTKS